MKLVTTAGDLRAALATVKHAIEPRNTIPVLGTVLIDGQSVTATNLDMTITTKVAAIQSGGRACISYRPLAALCRHLPADEQISIEASDKRAAIRFSSGLCSLPLLPADDFPSDNAIDVEAHAIDGDALAKALRFVVRFISTEETRYYLSGACLSADAGGHGGAVTTDGHRLGFHPMDFPDAWRGTIIPRQAVEAILAMPPVKTMAVAGPRARIDCGSVTITTKLIDGTFPDWLRVVPPINAAAPTIALDVAETATALRRIVGIKTHRGTALTIAADRRGVVAQSGEAHSDARVVERLTRSKCDAFEPVLACLNPAYMRDVLAAHRGNETVTLWPSMNDPMIVRHGDSRAFAVIMPMRGGEVRLAQKALEEWAGEPASFREAAE